MRESWITQVGSKSNDKCPCKRKAEGDLRHTEKTGEEGVKMEAEAEMVGHEAGRRGPRRETGAGVILL